MVANYYKPGPATEPGQTSQTIAGPWSVTEIVIMVNGILLKMYC